MRRERAYFFGVFALLLFAFLPLRAEGFEFFLRAGEQRFIVLAARHAGDGFPLFSEFFRQRSALFFDGGGGVFLRGGGGFCLAVFLRQAQFGFRRALALRALFFLLRDQFFQIDMLPRACARLCKFIFDDLFEPRFAATTKYVFR